MLNAVKVVVGMGTSFSTGFVMGTAMQLVKPQNLTKTGEIMWKVGTGAISGVVGVAAANHVEGIIDDITAVAGNIKKKLNKEG